MHDLTHLQPFKGRLQRSCPMPCFNCNVYCVRGSVALQLTSIAEPSIPHCDVVFLADL